MSKACCCGAIGDILPADVGYARDVRRALVGWHGGNVGAGRLAVEELSPGLSACPICQRRACAYVVALPPARGGGETSGR